MLELIFTVCSILSGAQCRELSPMQLNETTGMTGCMIAAQIEGAKWSNAHPNHYIIRSTCQPAKVFAKI